jgi:hypothetical protein
MTFVGLDLHKRYITACALDAVGVIVGELRRLPVSLEALLDFLRGFPQPVTVGMEATLYWHCCTTASRPRGTRAGWRMRTR